MMLSRNLTNEQYEQLVALRDKYASSSTVMMFVKSKFNAKIKYRLIPGDLDSTSWKNYDKTIEFNTEQDLTWFYLHV